MSGFRILPAGAGKYGECRGFGFFFRSERSERSERPERPNRPERFLTGPTGPNGSIRKISGFRVFDRPERPERPDRPGRPERFFPARPARAGQYGKSRGFGFLTGPSGPSGPSGPTGPSDFFRPDRPERANTENLGYKSSVTSFEFTQGKHQHQLNMDAAQRNARHMARTARIEAARPPPPPPQTFWDFLEDVWYCRDAFIGMCGLIVSNDDGLDRALRIDASGCWVGLRNGIIANTYDGVRLQVLFQDIKVLPPESSALGSS
jgi:hypothetical protein